MQDTRVQRGLQGPLSVRFARETSGAHQNPDRGLCPPAPFVATWCHFGRSPWKGGPPPRSVPRMEMMMAADAPYTTLTDEIEAARSALIGLAQTEQASHWWNAYDLKTQARNGWSAGAMSLAMNQLIDDGTFEVNDDRRVRLRTP
jgi:hypothetical protein